MTPTSEHAIWLNCFISWSTWYYTISHVHCLQKFPSAPFAGPHSLSLSSPFFLLLHCISISHACRSRPVPYGQLCSKWLGPHQSTQDSCPVPPFPRRPRQSKLPSFLLYPCLHSWQNRWVEIHMTYCTHSHNAVSLFIYSSSSWSLSFCHHFILLLPHSPLSLPTSIPLVHSLPSMNLTGALPLIIEAAAAAGEKKLKRESSVFRILCFVSKRRKQLSAISISPL